MQTSFRSPLQTNRSRAISLGSETHEIGTTALGSSDMEAKKEEPDDRNLLVGEVHLVEPTESWFGESGLVWRGAGQ